MGKQEEETTLDALSDASSPSPATATSIAFEEGFTNSPSTTTTTTTLTSTTTLTPKTTPAATTTSIAFEEDFTTTEINAEQSVTLGSGVEGGSTTEDIFEEDTSDDYLEDEAMITETATRRPEEETLAGVSLPETSTAEGDIEDSGASEELNTLRPETFEERLTTTENTYEETATAQTTTTIPEKEEQTDQPTIIEIEDSEASDELNTLPPETIEELPEHLTIIENIY